VTAPVATWRVELTYRAPARDSSGRLVDTVFHEHTTDRTAAHAIARRWATGPLPAGAVDVELVIYGRNEHGANIVTEPWELGATTSNAAQALAAARLRLVR